METTLRETVLRELTAGFGEPNVLPTSEGKLYRWILKSQGGDPIRLTLDSPEFSDLAHLVISDVKAVPRVNSATVRTLEEIRELVKTIQERLGR